TLACVVDGGSTGVGVESTVIDCTQDIPVILRPGGITKEQLEQVVGTVMIDPALANADEKLQPKSPGMKYKHYAPDVPLWLVDGSVAQMQGIVDQELGNVRRVGALASTETAHQLVADKVISLGANATEIAVHLYDGLRTFKEGDVD